MRLISTLDPFGNTSPFGVIGILYYVAAIWGSHTAATSACTVQDPGTAGVLTALPLHSINHCWIFLPVSSTVNCKAPLWKGVIK